MAKLGVEQDYINRLIREVEDMNADIAYKAKTLRKTRHIRHALDIEAAIKQIAMVNERILQGFDEGLW